MTMQATTMSVWKAFRRTGERYKRGDGSASNYWVAYCIGFPLRHLVGSRTGEQFAVEMLALVRDD